MYQMCIEYVSDMHRMSSGVKLLCADRKCHRAYKNVHEKMIVYACNRELVVDKTTNI